MGYEKENTYDFDIESFKEILESSTREVSDQYKTFPNNHLEAVSQLLLLEVENITQEELVDDGERLTRLDVIAAVALGKVEKKEHLDDVEEEFAYAVEIRRYADAKEEFLQEYLKEQELDVKDAKQYFDFVKESTKKLVEMVMDRVLLDKEIVSSKYFADYKKEVGSLRGQGVNNVYDVIKQNSYLTSRQQELLSQQQERSVRKRDREEGALELETTSSSQASLDCDRENEQEKRTPLGVVDGNAFGSPKANLKNPHALPLNRRSISVEA